MKKLLRFKKPVVFFDHINEWPELSRRSLPFGKKYFRLFLKLAFYIDIAGYAIQPANFLP